MTSRFIQGHGHNLELSPHPISLLDSNFFCCANVLVLSVVFSMFNVLELAHCFCSHLLKLMTLLLLVVLSILCTGVFGSLWCGTAT